MAACDQETRTRTILVVDDDAEMRTLIHDFLRGAGFAVREAASGSEAVAAVEVQHPDVVILDKEMPGMGGFDVLARLQRCLPGTPVILVTAFGGQHVAEQAFLRGAARYLEKPFRVHDLVLIVQSLTESLGHRPC
jgi:CheY-like chemotaxis protein